MKKTGYFPVLLLMIISVFTACKKEIQQNPAVPEMRVYSLKDSSGAVAGNFTIGTNTEGVSVITIELEAKSHRHGTVYTAMLCHPIQQNCYAMLNDVNAVIGYSETTGIKEQSSGKQLKAGELCKKTGYLLRISSTGGLVASGTIE
jgi:hypothetical protein